MKDSTEGFSTIIIVLLVASVFLAGGYYMYSSSNSKFQSNKQIKYSTLSDDESDKKSVNRAPILEEAAEGCELFETNPNLAERFDQTDVPSCGSIPAGVSDTIALTEVKECIETAIDDCAESKAYVYVQGFEGSIEYLITTNNCEAFVERWGTTRSYCGSKLASCKVISDLYPQDICESDGDEDKNLFQQL